MGVEAIASLGERLGTAKVIWEDAGTRTRSAKGLELRLTKRWNEYPSHYDGRKTGKVVMNVQEWDG